MSVLTKAEAGDEELVAAVRAGDDAAFEELYRRYRRRVAGFVARMVGDVDRAEDVAQEAFLSALRRLRATDNAIAFKPWMFEIAKNAAIDHLRRAGRAEEVSLHSDGALRPGDELRLAGGTVPPDLAYEGKERLARLTGAFESLSDNHWQILVLRELEGLSYREIGERMGLSRSAVESTLFRARRRLNEEYAALELGERCVAVAAAIARLAAGTGTARDRRTVGRHALRCAGCRREARELGVPVDVGFRRRVAAVLPLPAFLDFRRGEDLELGALVAGSKAGSGAWASALAGGGAEGAAAGAWDKVAAVLATVAIAGGGVAIQQQVVRPDRGVEPREAAPAADPAHEREAAPARPARRPRARRAAPERRAVTVGEVRRREARGEQRDRERARRAPAPEKPAGKQPAPERSTQAKPAEPVASPPPVQEIVEALPPQTQQLVTEQLRQTTEALGRLPQELGSSLQLDRLTRALGLDGRPLGGGEAGE